MAATRGIELAEFAAGCLDVVEQVARTGDEIVITKDGKPLAKLSRYGQRPATLAGLHRHSVRIVGDIVSPVYMADETDPAK